MTTIDLWLVIGLAMAFVGLVMYRVGLAMQQKKNKNGGIVSLIAWFFIMVGAMAAFAAFRAKYLS